MKILLYSPNFSPELTGIGKYNGEFVQWLAKNDHFVSIVTAPAYYPEWQRHQGFINWWSKVKESEQVIIYRCPLYVPKTVTTLKRLFHLSTFALSSAIRMLLLLRLKPEVLFLVQPTLFCAPMALLYCKLTGAKAVMHIQDFEIDAMFGLGMGRFGFLKKVIRYFESCILKRFDLVSSISFNMLKNARTKGVSDNKLHFFPNWADTDFITPDISGDKLREEWGYNPKTKIVLYSGNIGKKQGLEVVLDAAEALKRSKNVKFVIIGNGTHKKKLQGSAIKRDLPNVIFKPLQPWELMPQILSMADIHLVVQKRGAADSVLPSKLVNILAAGGHALVTADTGTELGVIADAYPGIYRCVEPENTKVFINELIELLSQNTKSINTVARNYAVNNISINQVIGRFVDVLKTQIKRD